jgi:hypothetical protein
LIVSKHIAFAELQIRICEISNGTVTNRKKRSNTENQLVPVQLYPLIEVVLWVYN